MKKLISEQIVLNEANEIKLLQERLTDNSKVYNVMVDHAVMFYCEDLHEAETLFKNLINTDHSLIH